MREALAARCTSRQTAGPGLPTPPGPAGHVRISAAQPRKSEARTSESRLGLPRLRGVRVAHARCASYARADTREPAQVHTNGDRKLCSDKVKGHMEWVKAPVRVPAYTIRAGDGTPSADAKAYTPGALVSIHVRVTKSDWKVRPHPARQSRRQGSGCNATLLIVPANPTTRARRSGAGS